MKGQYFSFDAIIASVIFVLALVALLSYWHSVRSFLDFQNEALGKDAVRVSNLLFTPPYPFGPCQSIERLGFAFAWDDRRVDEALLKCAETKDQDELKESLGTSNNLSITVTNLATDAIVVTIGGDVPADADDVVKLRRLATAVDSNGDTYLAAIDLSVYEKKPR